MAADPGLGEVVGVHPGQILDEVVLLVAVDRRQVRLFEQAVILSETRGGRVFLSTPLRFIS